MEVSITVNMIYCTPKKFKYMASTTEVNTGLSGDQDQSGMEKAVAIRCISVPIPDRHCVQSPSEPHAFTGARLSSHGRGCRFKPCITHQKHYKNLRRRSDPRDALHNSLRSMAARPRAIRRRMVRCGLLGIAALSANLQEFKRFEWGVRWGLLGIAA